MHLATAHNAAQRLTIRVDGDIQVWHAWGTSRAKPPLLLLHGGSGSWTHWVKNVLSLSETRRVWALDLPGFGDSELPSGAQDVDDLIEPVSKGIAQLFGEEPVDVAGFSFGGMLAGLIAASYPNRFSTVLILGTPGLGLFDGPPPHIRGFTPEMSDEQRQAVHRHNLKSFMLHHEDSITEETLLIQSLNVARDRLKRRRLARTDVVVQAQHRWQRPVHFAFGAKDAMYPDRLHRIEPLFSPQRLSSFTLIPDAGHWTMYERPQSTIEWMVCKLG
ncbi:MAG: hypothetical protein RL111_1994 [Pseudomonadota bacterium]|jgi:pimeloyl-ACP methyl ester carboxylesterase